MGGMIAKESIDFLTRPVQDDPDVGIPSGPRIFEKCLSLRFELRSQPVPKPIQSFSKRSAPSLIPPGLCSRVASTIGFPSLDSVKTAPRRVLMDLNFFSGGKLFQKFPVVCDLGELSRFDRVERIGQGHLTIAVLMPEGFSIRCYVDKLRVSSIGREGTYQTVGKIFTARQKFFKGHSPCDRGVIEKYVNVFS